MRHTPCGCRSAHLVEVQPNFRLPPVPTMRRASAMPHSARSLPPSKRHSRLTIVRRGCNRCRIAGIHGEAMYTAPDCAARAALQATSPQCEFSLGGCKGGVSLFQKEIPLPYPHPLRGAGNGCSAARCQFRFPYGKPLSPEARSCRGRREHENADAARSVPPARRCWTRRGNSQCPSPW